MVSVRLSARPPTNSRMVIQPAAISIIRRDRLPVCGVRAPPTEPATSAGAGASTGGVSAASAASFARRLVGVVEAVTESTDGGDHVGAQLLANPGTENPHCVQLRR